MPTVSFFVYLLTVAAALLLRLGYPGWSWVYLLFALCALPVLMLLLSLPSMRSMELRMKAPKTVERGQDITLRLSFRSARFMPVGRARIRMEVENRFTQESRRLTYSFSQLCSGDAAETLSAAQCGTLEVRVLHWECRDLLGLFSLRRALPEPLSCTVLPPPTPPEQIPDFDAVMLQPARLKPKHGGGYAEDHDLRDYRPGDAGNSIHWKLSSKTDRLIVREALEPENDRIYLVLSPAGQAERALEVLYWLSLELCRRELPHIIAADRLYPVSGELESAEAFAGLLSSPLAEPCAFDRASARCVFTVVGGEVRLT